MLYEKKDRKKRNLYIVIKKKYKYCYIRYIQKNKNTWEIYIKTETKNTENTTDIYKNTLTKT